MSLGAFPSWVDEDVVFDYKYLDMLCEGLGL